MLGLFIPHCAKRQLYVYVCASVSLNELIRCHGEGFLRQRGMVDCIIEGSAGV